MKRRWSFTATLLLALLLGAGLASGQDNFQVVRNVRLLASPNLDASSAGARNGHRWQER